MTASVDECVAAMAAARAVAGHSPGTIKLDTWLLGAIGKPPDEATLADLEQLLLRSRNRSTRATYAGRLRSTFALLRDLGIITTTVDQQLPKLAMPRTLPRPLSDAQVARLASHARAPMVDAIRLALLTGARASEVWALRGDDLSDGLHGPELLLHGKGSKDVHVPAHPAVVDIIEGYGRMGRLFDRWSCPQVLSQACGREMRRVLEGSFEFHQCRHTFATRLLQATGDLRVVQTLMRHEDIATTLIYAKLADEKPRQAIDLLVAV